VTAQDDSPQIPAVVENVCPDCRATGTLTETAPGVYAFIIAHSTTCPAYAHLLRENGGTP